MSDWRNVEHTAIPTRMKYTHDGKLLVQEQQDEKLILDHVSDMGRAIRESGRRKDHALGHYVGTIPLVLYHQWLKSDPDIAHDPRKLALKLKGADFSKLRV